MGQYRFTYLKKLQGKVMGSKKATQLKSGMGVQRTSSLTARLVDRRVGQLALNYTKGDTPAVDEYKSYASLKPNFH